MGKTLLAVCLLVSVSCSNVRITESGLKPANFEKTVDEMKTGLYTITNGHGMEVCLTNYGGRVVSIMVPDRNGKKVDVVLGFDNIEDYLNIPNNFGATIGRYGNRIADGKIKIDGIEYQLPKNDFGHCLHGGPNGWDHKIFNLSKQSEQSLTFSCCSLDGEANFPGTVNADVTFTVTEGNELKIEYKATTDKKTVINMTNHSYFNLDGNAEDGILQHELYINADGFTPIDSTFMTDGTIEPVKDTPMDFTTAKQIGQDINADYIQLKNGRGYDHNWVLNTKGDINQIAASVYSAKTGIKMEVYTDEPGLQVYTGNFLDGSFAGKKDLKYIHRASICLETQHYPNTPNNPQWPSCILKPGEVYHSTCIYKFSIEK